jgi:hypothetical protein
MPKTSKPVRLKNPLRIRTVVQRRHAVGNLLVMLLSFAFSVTATRIFLNLTGFPQLGGNGLHIAHVLWGGLFLFIASLLPLIWVNQWVLALSAVLSGLGVGLFIDEVGKFITSTNDYFFPTAAPIIYAFFLLAVLVFTQVRTRRDSGARAQMYRVLEDFAEVLDRDLSQQELEDLQGQINRIIQEREDPQLVNMAQSLKEYLNNKGLQVVPHQPDLYERVVKRWQKFEKKWLTRPRMRKCLIAGLLLWAAWALTSQIVMYLTTHNAAQFQLLLEEFMANNLVRNASGMNWFEAQILLEGAMGIIALASAIFFMLKKDTIGIWLGIADLVITLVVVNLLTFYFNQFSTIGFAVVQFVLLVLLLSYKRRFMDQSAAKHRH